jgi:dienelactone hydrolase
MNTPLSRRAMLAALTGAAASGRTWAQSPMGMTKYPKVDPWPHEESNGRRVYKKGSGPAVILMHEINGLSPGCIDFGKELVSNGFTVFMPLFFGHWGEDTGIFGYFQSCWGSFACNSKDNEGEAGKWLRTYVADLATKSNSIGVIGMCLSGGLPLVTMPNEKVRAVVMSQPAIPFGGGDKQASVGVNAATIAAAKQSGKPILGFRFKADTICQGERFTFLRNTFGAQFTGHELDPPKCFRPHDHRLHAVLTGPFQEVTHDARAEVIGLFKKNLI